MDTEVTLLRCGSTNAYYIAGTAGGLLTDTGYAGTLPLLFRALKAAGIGLHRITYVLATHYHPDHIGLIGELQALGVRLLLAEPQCSAVHFADGIFARDSRLTYRPPDEQAARVIPLAESRAVLSEIGIAGEIIRTPSHSADSISLILDSGTCIVGDLEPLEYLAAYEQNPALETDWAEIMRRSPKRVLYAHVNEKILG